jgi:hypothetical protein
MTSILYCPQGWLAFYCLVAFLILAGGLATALRKNNRSIEGRKTVEVFAAVAVFWPLIFLLILIILLDRAYRRLTK